jgi:hypothetical protein
MEYIEESISASNDSKKEQGHKAETGNRDPVGILHQRKRMPIQSIQILITVCSVMRCILLFRRTVLRKSWINE